MAIVPLTLPSGSNPARFKQGGTQELVNCYREDLGKEAKVPFAVYASSGLQGFCDLQQANGGIRALKNVDGILHVVAGTRKYHVKPNGDQVFIGSMTIDANAPLYMERNRRSTPDILHVCDGIAYNERSGTLTQVSDSDLIAPICLTFNNGYFVIGSVDNQFQSSDLDDGTSWQALAFGRADASPDAIVALGVLGQQLLVCGERTIEVQTDEGSTPFPYERVAVIDFGVLAPRSLATVSGTVAFVAHDGTVRYLEGYSATRISTHAQERDISALADPSVIKGTSWVENGHTFYKISCSEFTWVYDTLTGFWHRRQTYGQKHWNISFIEQFDNKLIAGDATTGKLYEMDQSFFDDAGLPIVSRVEFAPVHAFPYRLTFNEIFFDIEAGVGTGQGETQDVDPKAMIELSRDGGATFGLQRMLSLGKQGQRMTRVRSTRFGQFGEDGAVIALSWSGKFARALYSASADVTQGGA